MTRPQFDTLDLRILQSLSTNARKPYLEIARENGVSGAAVHQRIQRLMANGIIKGSESIIDPSTVGFDTCAYVGFFLRDPSISKDIVEKLRQIPEVVECHYTTGQYDMFIKLYARNNDHLLDILQNQIQALGLVRTETLISFKEVFKRQVPVTHAAKKKDKEKE
ncbi:MAG: Lrp/AsnC ligand binding domain-containing protein [Muribaculaceae bacterium]|nr:Lrp/AsnC ligand binding domain-containing protein [Muribaculaceae bacterium]